VKLAPDFVSSWALVLSVLTFRLCQLISNMGLRQIGCHYGKWIELGRALVLAVFKVRVLLPVM